MAWMFILIGLALGGTSLLGGLGVLKRNSWFGIRMAATWRSAAAWQAGHARAARVMAPAGLAYCTLGVGTFLGWPFLDGLAQTHGIAAVGGAVAVAVVGAWMARGAADAA